MLRMRPRDYTIHRNDLNGLWWIEKDGQFICYATDRTHAITIIEQDLAPRPIDQKGLGS